MFTWKTFVWSTVAGLSLLAGLPGDADACCGWWGGRTSYYAGYYPAYYGGYSGYYGAGYYGGYYGGYAPSYGGCSSCGSCYGGCSSCGPSCGYACAGSGCAGGNCGVSTPASNSENPPRPQPDDGFRGGSGGNPADNAPADAPPGGRRRRTPSTYSPNEEAPLNSPGGSTRTNTGNPRNEGLDSTRGSGTRPAPESSPATEDESFDAPLRSKKSGAGSTTSDPFGTKRPVDPKAKDNDPDAFIEEEEATPAKTKTNRQDLGDPSIIPQKKPAPSIEIPDDDPPPKPGQPEALKADEAATTTAVAPRTRLALSGRFATPKVVRLKLRPNQDWIATQAAPVLAKHETQR